MARNTITQPEASRKTLKLGATINNRYMPKGAEILLYRKVTTVQ